MNDRQTTVMQLRRKMTRFVAERDWQKFHQPKNLAMSLAIETAELMEHFQWLTHQQVRKMIKDAAARKEIADEMADVLSFLLSLANAMEIDLSGSFESKMAANEKRYPPAMFKGRYGKRAAAR